jgi:autotransporter adhesin
VASESNTVSPGNASLKRRLVNVADGAVNGSSTDAVNGRQLQGARDLAQRGLDSAAAAQRTANSASTTATTASTTANTAKSTADQALVNRRLVSQVSTYGDVRIGAENTGTVLDVRNRYSTNRKISGVANATLNPASTDAVNGRQLNTTNGNVTTAQSTANAAKTAASSAQDTANSAAVKADVLSGLIAQTSATGDVRLGGSNGGSTFDVRNNAGTARKIKGVADATLGMVDRVRHSGEDRNDGDDDHELHQREAGAASAVRLADESFSLRR